MKTSLIISVYNKIRELELIFYTLTIQSFKDFEVIVAEDGRDPGMNDFIKDWKSRKLLPVKHITQDDNGFRKNKILNEAIRNSSSDYLIFIDGDCLLHPDFIKAHFENKTDNTVLCGRRVNLTKNITDKINRENILNLEYTKIKLADIIGSSVNRKKKNSNFNIEEGIIYRNKALRKVLTNEDEHILGCNFSVHKSLLEKINGFDETYEGPGLGEDSDIEFRLRLTGTKFKSVRNLAVQYHMYHDKTVEEPKNMEYFNEMKKRKEFFCNNGLVK